MEHSPFNRRTEVREVMIFCSLHYMHFPVICAGFLFLLIIDELVVDTMQ